MKKVRHMLACAASVVLAAAMLTGCNAQSNEGETSSSSEQSSSYSSENSSSSSSSSSVFSSSASDSESTDSSSSASSSSTADSESTDSSSSTSSSSAADSESTDSSSSTSSSSAADSESTDSSWEDSSSSTASSSSESASGDEEGTDPAATIITAVVGYEESLYITWETSNAANDRVMYRISGESSYTTFTDSSLITALSTTEARADIVGLTAGEYDIQILSGGYYYNTTVTVEEYDRSGYAHFNYTDGVGAYNDDGTLKNNTVVIYLTDSNKNDITDYVYLYKNGSLTHISTSTVKSWFSSSAGGYGIGYFLNNGTYTGGVGTVTNTYAGLDIRVIGTVNAEVTGDGTASEIDGLRPWVDYTDVDGDGGRSDGDKDGDNGRYASIVDAENLTIEGIGEDAVIRGWGFSFAAKTSGYGYGFEVRNLTFTRYSEDAIGMEGQAEGTTITVPVQRCWIHNNSFYVGYCAADSTWEGDKGDGDGSCDFKRGEYFTFSYNYLEGCHKTNLIGASDTCPQYNLTIHHNYYNSCSARMPLIRMANMHYYNNYVYGATSSAISSRGNNYTYSEYNYYENNYVAIETKTNSSGAYGAVKSYNDVFVTSNSSKYPNKNAATVVTSRSTTVTNACYDEGKGVDYSTFDTDSTLFYYNDYSLMPDAAAAKEEVIASAGVHKASSSSGSAASGTSVEVNISDLEVGTLADGYELADGVYVSASSGMAVDISSKTYNEVTYTNRLKTGGAVYSAAIEIVTTGACTVTVYVTTSNSSDDKLVGLFNSQDITDVYGSTQSIAASSSMPIYELTFKIYSAGTYYLGNGTSSGGINFYYIAVTY